MRRPKILLIWWNLWGKPGSALPNARLVESRAGEGVFRRSHSDFRLQFGKLPAGADGIKAKVIQKQRSYKSAFGSEP